MQMAHLYPPGRVWWAIRDGDLDPINRVVPAPQAESSKLKEIAAKDKVRTFEVLDVEQVFGQIIFAGDMLRCEYFYFLISSILKLV